MPYENHECELKPGAVAIMRRRGTVEWKMHVSNLGDPARVDGADFVVNVRLDVRACPFCGERLGE